MITIVDGGYLAWCYGPEVMMHRAWTTQGRSHYGRNSNCLICLDDQVNWRSQLFASYKIDRKLRTASDPVRQRKHQAVVDFVSLHLREDPLLNTLQLPFCEADDLVAMLVMLQKGGEVIGVDKDLLQLPTRFSLKKRDGTETTVSSYAAKTPKRLKNLITEPRHVLLDLAIRGDSSDSIPPSIPPRRLEIADLLLSSVRPFSRGAALLGNDFIRNLFLAVLPGPYCLEYQFTNDDLVEAVESGEYWSLPYREEFLEKLEEALTSPE